MATQARLRARPPTGNVAYPLVLVEGPEKSGKSAQSYLLSASPHVNRSFVFDMGEGTADEYKHLGPYEVVDHNGTFTDLRDQVALATKVPMAEGKPNLIVLDDGSNLWDLLKDWTGARARRSKYGQKVLADDPDAEVKPSSNLWNDASDRWYDIVNLLRMWDGIAIIIARGREVTKFDGDRPVAGQTEYSVEVQKGTPAAVSAIVRMSHPHTATLMRVRSFNVEVPPRGIVLPEPNPLEHLVFNVLGAGGFAASSRVQPSLGVDIAAAKTRLVDTVFRCGYDPDAAREKAAGLWIEAFGQHKPGEHPDVAPQELTALLLKAAELPAPVKAAAA